MIPIRSFVTGVNQMIYYIHHRAHAELQNMAAKKQFKVAFFTFLTMINIKLLVDCDHFKLSCAMVGQQVAHSLGCNVHVQLL